MKKLLAVLLAAIMVASVFAGCGTTATVDSGDAAKETEAAGEAEAAETDGDVIEIRAAWWGDTSRHDKYNEICDRFEAANPGIKVVREYGSWSDYWDKLATQVAANNAPDFMGMHVQYASDYAGRGVLADLQQFVDAGILDISNMSEGVINDCKYTDGTFFGLPMGLTTSANFTNMTLLKEHGIDYVAWNEDISWEAFEELGLKFQESAGTDAYFVGDISSDWNGWFRYWVRQDGGDIFTSDGQLGFDKEQLVDYWTYTTRLREEGIMPEPAECVEDSAAPFEERMFTRGVMAIASVPANQLYLYVEQMPDAELTLTRKPDKGTDTRAEYVEGAHWSISVNSTPEKQEAAAKLMNFWLTTEESMEIYQLDQGVAADSAMAEYVASISDELNNQVIDFVSDTSSLSRPKVYAPVGATEIQQAFEDAADQIRFETLTVEEAAEQFYAQATEILGANE